MIIGFSIIAFFVLIYYIIGYKRSFIIFFCYCFLDYGLKFLGGYTFKDAILLLYLMYAVIYFKKDFYFKSTAVVFIISYFLSELFASEHHWPATIFSLIRLFAPCYILSCIIEERKDLNFLIKSLITLSFIVCAYSFVELFLVFNPVVDLIYHFNHDSFTFYDYNNVRFGIQRLQAFFVHATTFSYFCVMLFAFFSIYLDSRLRKNMHLNVSYYIALFLLFVCTFLTGTRSSILPLIILAAILLGSKSLKNSNSFFSITFFLAISIVIISSYFYDYLNDIYLSFVNNSKFQGSSIEMREGQFLATFKYWMHNPLFGGGIAYAGKMMKLDSDLWGAESIWMSLLMCYGIVGVIAYVYALLSCFKLLRFQRIKAYMFMFVIVFVNSFTSVPGLDLGFILSMVVIAKSINDLSDENYRYTRIKGELRHLIGRLGNVRNRVLHDKLINKPQ